MNGKDAIKILEAVEKIPPEGGAIIVNKLPDGAITTRPYGEDQNTDKYWDRFKLRMKGWGQ
jgi:hypothetical protein